MRVFLELTGSLVLVEESFLRFLSLPTEVEVVSCSGGSSTLFAPRTHHRARPLTFPLPFHHFHDVLHNPSDKCYSRLFLCDVSMSPRPISLENGAFSRTWRPFYLALSSITCSVVVEQWWAWAHDYTGYARLRKLLGGVGRENLPFCILEMKERKNGNKIRK